MDQEKLVLLQQPSQCGRSSDSCRNAACCVGFAIFVVLLIILIACLCVQFPPGGRGCGMEGMADYQCKDNMEDGEDHVDAEHTSTEPDEADIPISTSCEESEDVVYSADWSNQLHAQVSNDRMVSNHKAWVKDLDGRYGGPVIVDDMNEAIESGIPYHGLRRTSVLKNRGIMAHQTEIDNTILPSEKSGDRLASLIGI